MSDTTGPAFDYVTGATYSNLGPLAQINFQNAAQTLLDWNNRGLVASIKTRKDLGGGSYTNHFHLTYDYYNNAQVWKILNQLASGNLKDEKYTYDQLGRLLTAQRGPDTNIQRKYNYELDRYNNRWKQDWVAGSYGIDIEMGFTTTNNRTTDTPPYAYDNSGNLTQNHQYTATNSFTYNPENFNVTAPNSTYVVDALGRRVKKTVSGTTTDVFYIGSDIIAEKTGSNWKDYIFFGGQRIAEQTGSGTSTVVYLHTDHLGSVRLCTDSSGGNAGTCDYEPYGQVQPGTTCSVPTKFRFAGMEWDSESELYHTWFRQYDTRQGRWMGVDPWEGDAEDPQSLNRFAYVSNDPTNLTDPLGLCDRWITEPTILGPDLEPIIRTYCDFYRSGGGGGVAGGVGETGDPRFVHGRPTSDWGWTSLVKEAKKFVCGVTQPLRQAALENQGALGIGLGGSLGIGVLFGGAGLEGAIQLSADPHGNIAPSVSFGGIIPLAPGSFGGGANVGAQFSRSESQSISSGFEEYGAGGISVQDVSYAVSRYPAPNSPVTETLTIGPGVGGRFSSGTTYGISWTPFTISCRNP